MLLQLENIHLEPHFVFAQERRLNPLLTASEFMGCMSYLEYKIRVDPRNLRLHVQRIFLCRHTALHDHLFSSLLDLLIALDGKGAQLRKRMIKLAGLILSTEEMSFLENYNGNALAKINAPGDASRSLLISQIKGNTELINEVAANQHNVSSLEQATDYLEYGQLDEAIGLLKDLVLQSPTDDELATLLTDILLAERNQGLFKIIYGEISQCTGESLPACWQLTAEKMAKISPFADEQSQQTGTL